MSKQQAPLEARTVFVHQVDSRVNEGELFDLFNTLGSVETVKKAFDAEKKITGFSVVFGNHRNAQLAVQHLDGVKYRSEEGLSVTSSVYVKQDVAVAADEEGGEGADQATARPPTEEEMRVAPHNHLLETSHRLDPMLIPGLERMLDGQSSYQMEDDEDAEIKREKREATKKLAANFLDMQREMADTNDAIAKAKEDMIAMQKEYQELMAKASFSTNERNKQMMDAAVSAHQREELDRGVPMPLLSSYRLPKTLHLARLDTTKYRPLTALHLLIRCFGPIARFVVQSPFGEHSPVVSIIVEFESLESAQKATAVLIAPPNPEQLFRSSHDELLSKRVKKENKPNAVGVSIVDEERRALMEEHAASFAELLKVGGKWEMATTVIPL